MSATGALLKTVTAGLAQILAGVVCVERLFLMTGQRVGPVAMVRDDHLGYPAAIADEATLDTEDLCAQQRKKRSGDNQMFRQTVHEVTEFMRRTFVKSTRL